MLLASDVHGAFADLARIAARGETLVMMGDFINFVDYRTSEGILADVLGREFVMDVSAHRARGDYAASRRLWKGRLADDAGGVRGGIQAAVERQYEELSRALSGGHGFTTFGNVDWPGLLQRSLPEGFRFVDGEVVEIDGLIVGMVGGGMPTPLGVPGEVSEVEMAEKLTTMGPVDVLCTHVPPAVPALRRDVITGRLEGGSEAVLEYVLRHRPLRHFFGDVHQPQATRWRIGNTLCVNVGYFRATRRGVRCEVPASYARAKREPE